MPQHPLTDLVGKSLILDGAMGTFLQESGLPEGTPSCLWNLQNPQAVQQIHQAYHQAGSQAVLTNTFCASRLFLDHAGLLQDLKKMNETGVHLARQGIGKDGWVLGDVGPTGVQGPFFQQTFEQRVSIFLEQLEVLIGCHVDGIVMETLGSFEEVRAALAAVEQVSFQGPLVLLVTISQKRKGLLEPDPVAVAKTVEENGRVSVLGVNCSEGPETVLTALRQMASVTRRPLCAKPNAGVPIRRQNRWVYPIAPQELGSYVPKFIGVGARWIGGCCGAHPDHIRAIGEAFRQRSCKNPESLM